MYLEYQKERLGIDYIQDEYGFATYKTITLNGNDYTYIEDIYVVPEKRSENIASKLADKITEIAINKGHSGLLGTVVPSTNNSTISLKVLLSYGFEVLSSEDDIIWLTKGI